jgi:hypothetical protein
MYAQLSGRNKSSERMRGRERKKEKKEGMKKMQKNEWRE